MNRFRIPGFWVLFDRDGGGEGGGEGGAGGDPAGGGGNAPAPAAGGDNAAPASSASPSFDWGKWADGLTDDGKKAYAKTFKSPDALLDGALNLRKEISTRIKVPGADAKPEEVAAFRNAIGAKEKPEEYKVATPDGYEMGEVQQALAGSMQQAAAEAGVPASAFEAFTKRYFEFEQQVQAQVAEEVAKFQRDSTAALKKEFGADFEKLVGIAENFVNQKLNVPEFTELLNETIQWNGVSMKLQSHPAVVKMLASIGQRTAEDGVIGFHSEGEKANLQQQIRALEEKWPMGRRTNAQDAEIRSLYAKLYGE